MTSSISSASTNPPKISESPNEDIWDAITPFLSPLDCLSVGASCQMLHRKVPTFVSRVVRDGVLDAEYLAVGVALLPCLSRTGLETRRRKEWPRLQKEIVRHFNAPQFLPMARWIGGVVGYASLPQLQINQENLMNLESTRVIYAKPSATRFSCMRLGGSGTLGVAFRLQRGKNLATAIFQESAERETGQRLIEPLQCHTIQLFSESQEENAVTLQRQEWPADMCPNGNPRIYQPDLLDFVGASHNYGDPNKYRALHKVLLGEHPTTCLDTPAIIERHQSRLQRELREELKIGLEFIDYNTFSSRTTQRVSVAEVVTQYLDLFDDVMMQSYQGATLRWGSFFQPDLLRAVGGLVHVLQFPRFQVNHTAHRQEELLHAMTAQKVHSVMVVETDCSFQLLVRIRQKQDSRNQVLLLFPAGGCYGGKYADLPIQCGQCPGHPWIVHSTDPILKGSALDPFKPYFEETAPNLLQRLAQNKANSSPFYIG